MCDIATAAIAVSAIGGVASFAGQQQAASAAGSNAENVARQQAAQAEYQAALQRNNQVYAENAAREAEQAGVTREQNQRTATAALIGRQRAVLGANGVDVNTGSALDIQTGTAQTGELDALTVRSNAQREALGFRNQGANFGGEAALYDARAANANAYRYDNSGAFLSGAGTLLSSGGSVAAKWYNFKAQGASGLIF